MRLLYWVLIGVAAFWGLVMLIDRYFDFESHNVEVSPGSLVWRTERGLGLIDRIANYSKRTWKIFGVSGAIICSILMISTFLNLTDKAVGIVNSFLSPAGGGGAAPAVMPIIPGWTLPIGLLFPIVVAIATVLLVHEPAHGITARRAGISLESTGLLIFAVIPGAFVEPDEEELNNAPILDRLQVYGAGSFSNILFGFAILGLLLCLVTPLPGLYVSGVYEDTPAHEKLRPGNRILGIGYEAENLHQVNTYQDFHSFLKDTYPGDVIWIKTDNRSPFSISLTDYPTSGEMTLITEDNEREVNFENKVAENYGFMGVNAWYYSISRPEFAGEVFGLLFTFWKSSSLGGAAINPYSYVLHVPWSIIQLLFWIFLVNMGVGLFNLLPLKPLDGGHIMECLSEKVSSKETAKYISIGVSGITLFIVMINFVPWLF